MRIGIDVRYLSHGLVGGIHTYLLNLIPELVSLSKDHEYFLYADTKRPFELPMLPDNVTLRMLPHRNALSSIRNDFSIRHWMANDDLDLVHFPSNYGFAPSSSPTVITLQDEINLLPLFKIIRSIPRDARYILTMTYLHYCTLASMRLADRVITVSDYSKSQICRYASLVSQKVAVIPHACPGDMWRVEEPQVLAEVRSRLGLTRPFVLAEAFKNPGVLVRAWHALLDSLRESTEIVFFSRSASVLPVVHEAVSAGYARLLVRPARRDLRALYTLAHAFVFPSWIEGFGIPLLEAMACGAPIIASNRGAIPEVVGDAAWLIDAEDEQTLCHYLRRVLIDPEERERLSTLGFEREAEFTWPRIAQQVLGVYEQAVC